MAIKSLKLPGLGVLLAGILLATLAGATPAFAAAPWWQVSSGSTPAYLSPGPEGKIIVSVTNIGDATADGATSPVTIVEQTAVRPDCDRHSRSK